jgi:hypothetical protein
MTALRAALGLRAGRGGSVVVGVALEDDAPRVVLSSFLATAAPGDRLAYEPYHVAAEMAAGAPPGEVPAEVAGAVADGRRRQAELAASGLAAIRERLQGAGFAPVVAALLINRAGWVTDLLRYSLAMADHPPVAEGLAVREALRSAFGVCGLAASEMDEKALPGLASAALGLTPEGLDARLKALGAVAGRPWRKEQKLACLAAWMALVA